MVTNMNDVDATRQIGVTFRALLLAGVERRAEETDDRHSCPGSGADNQRAGFGIDLRTGDRVDAGWGHRTDGGTDVSIAIDPG